MKLSAVTVAFLLLFLALPQAAPAEELTGKQIVEKMKEVESYQDSFMKVNMILVNRRGEERQRKLINRMKKFGDQTKTVTTFLYPDDVKGTKFLVEEVKGGDDIQKLFLPALDKIRRISSSQKKQSFMGTDFSFGDLQSRDPEKGTHNRVGEDKMHDHDCYMVESVPAPDSDSEYSKTLSYVRKDNYLPVRVKFFDKDGEQVKELHTEDHYLQDGIWMARRTIMMNLRKGSKTILEIVEQKNNSGIKDDFFSDRFLRAKTQY